MSTAFCPPEPPTMDDVDNGSGCTVGLAAIIVFDDDEDGGAVGVMLTAFWLDCCCCVFWRCNVVEYLCWGIVTDWRIFFSGCKRIMYNFGENRHNNVTVALSDIETDNVVKLSAIWLLCDDVKYIGTNASHIIQVVYIVKPMNFDSLNASGILRVITA